MLSKLISKHPNRKYFNVLVNITMLIPLIYRKSKYIPCSIPKFCFRSEASGNCLFSSVLIYLTGSNSLVEDLRAATAIELYLNSSFYSHHPYIVSLSQNYPNIFRCPENVLMMSVSQKSIDSNKKTF